MPNKSFYDKNRFSSLAKAAKQMEQSDQLKSSKAKNKKKDIEEGSSFRFSKNLIKGKELAEEIDIHFLYPAPSDWNFYAPLSDEKMEELKESIRKNGLLHPIVVWRQEKGYMILSGHNRVQAVKELYEATKKEDYLVIKAVVKDQEELTEETAKEIIIDTNWIQRQLSPMEKVKSITSKYIGMGRKEHTGDGQKTRDLVAEDFGMSGRMVSNYLRLNRLIQPLQEQLTLGRLTLKNAIAIARLPNKLQEYLADHASRKQLNHSKIRSISPKASLKTVKTLLAELAVPYVTIQFSMPKNLEKDFKQMAEKWLADRENQS